MLSYMVLFMPLDGNLAFSTNVAAFERAFLEAFPNLVFGRHTNQKVRLTTLDRLGLLFCTVLPCWHGFYFVMLTRCCHAWHGWRVRIGMIRYVVGEDSQWAPGVWGQRAESSPLRVSSNIWANERRQKNTIDLKYVKYFNFKSELKNVLQLKPFYNAAGLRHKN